MLSLAELIKSPFKWGEKKHTLDDQYWLKQWSLDVSRVADMKQQDDVDSNLHLLHYLF